MASWGRSSPAIGSLASKRAGKGCDPSMAAQNVPDSQLQAATTLKRRFQSAGHIESAVAGSDRIQSKMVARSRSRDRCIRRRPQARSHHIPWIRPSGGRSRIGVVRRQSFRRSSDASHIGVGALSIYHLAIAHNAVADKDGARSRQSERPGEEAHTWCLKVRSTSPSESSWRSQNPRGTCTKSTRCHSRR
jgi:hypothetical protein